MPFSFKRAVHTMRAKTNDVLVTKTCAITKQEYSVTVPLDAYTEWRNGRYIQDALHMLNADQREFVLSGITPAEREDMYGDPRYHR